MDNGRRRMCQQRQGQRGIHWHALHALGISFSMELTKSRILAKLRAEVTGEDFGTIPSKSILYISTTLAQGILLFFDIIHLFGWINPLAALLRVA